MARPASGAAACGAACQEPDARGPDAGHFAWQGLSERQRATERGHRRPCLRCLGEHGGDRRRTDPNGRRARGGHGLRRAPAAGVIVGVVAFSDGGIAVQSPTRDRAAILSSIERLSPQKGTSLGQGILVALHAVDIALNPPPTDYYSQRSPAPTPEPTPVPADAATSAVIVLLTDGENDERPIRSTPRSKQLIVASASTPSPSAAQRASISTSTASSSTRSSTRICSIASRRPVAGRPTRRPTRRR